MCGATLEFEKQKRKWIQILIMVSAQAASWAIVVSTRGSIHGDPRAQCLAFEGEGVSFPRGIQGTFLAVLIILRHPMMGYWSGLAVSGITQVPRKCSGVPRGARESCGAED